MKLLEIQSKIEEVRDKYMQDRDYNGDEITRDAVKLAAYNANLGKYLAEVAASYQDTRATRKLEHAKSVLKYRDLDKTVADSESLARIDIKEDKEQENSYYKNMKYFKILHGDTGMLISVLMSRSKYLISEKVQSNLPNPENG